jgi:hypothetical protein
MRFRRTGEEKGKAPVKHIIERKLAAGVLPDRPPVQYWAGFGVGQPCDGCDEPILDTQVEYEVAFDAFPTVRLHAVCTEIWGALVAHAGPAAAGGA